MNSIAIYATLVILLVCIYSSDAFEWKEEAVNEVCKNIKNSNNMFFPFRCSSEDEDFGRIGRNYLKSHPKVEAATLAPVVLFPGFGGSGLEARLDKSDSPAWYCFETYDWFRIWLSVTELFVQDCWMDNMKVFYNANNNTYTNTWGVEMRGIDFGGTEGVAYLDYIFGFPVPFTAVYATLIASLEEIGYVSGQNLHGVTYDWRIPPTATGQSDFYLSVQQLIEETYANNSNTPVHIVTHSMGGPTFLYFLNQMTQTWKDTYLATFIPIAGPFAGSPKALRALISGDNFGIEFLGLSLADKLRFRYAVREAGGLIFMVPDPLFWEDQVFVYTESKNYTASDLQELFLDIGTPETATVYATTWDLIPSLKPPTVPTYCLYGTNNPTEFFYHYPTNDFDSDPTIIDTSDLGDGTVPLRSLKECSTWESQQTQPVTVQEFDMRDHTSIIEDEDVVNYILNIVTQS